MLAGSTLELSWDNEIKNGLEPAVSIQYTGSSNLFFTPSAADYNFSVSHKTYCSDSDTSMTTTTKIRGLTALAAYLDLRCESSGHWRLATIVDRNGMIVYELSKKSQGPARGGFIEFGMFGPKNSWGRTHSELLEVWKNMI